MKWQWNFDRYDSSTEVLLPGLLFAMLVRWCVAAYPYSGYRKPPMFGDYEAQRHWQEITVHTPIVKWYHNTTQNDLQYWGLDYPPLTAYHSFLMGLVADWLDPESVRLFASRGYENDSHKNFMRWTVFLSDVYFYVTAVLCLCRNADISIDSRKYQTIPYRKTSVFDRIDIATTLFLLYPGLILIDHGHFQYNCISLGLFLWAVFFTLVKENDVLSTIFFVLALNYKQMELYHALPFFVYMLRKCFIGLPFGKNKLAVIVNRFNKLALVVISCFGIIWYPFMTSREDVLQVLHRLFPIGRGIFEDKVSNVWCVVNVFIKLKTVFKNEEMAMICLLTTAMAAIPACLEIFCKINPKKLVLCLINVSLAFFLFSFQVHEKTILLVAIPVCLHFANDPFMCFWFLIVSSFSMLPLFLKDELIIPFVVTNLIYISFYSMCCALAMPENRLFSMFDSNNFYTKTPVSGTIIYLRKLLNVSFFFSMISMISLTVLSVFMEPPQHLPDLFPLLISVFSCFHFLFFLFYFYYRQFSMIEWIPLNWLGLKYKPE